MQKDNKESLKIAGRQFSPDDYERKDTVSSGLAITHEQVNDHYMEGAANADNIDEKDTDNPRKEG